MITRIGHAILQPFVDVIVYTSLGAWFTALGYTDTYWEGVLAAYLINLLIDLALKHWREQWEEN